jgi:HEAT repeat protein
VTEAEEWEAIGRDLRAAGVDPTDFGRFVGRPLRDLGGLEPETFDARGAYPVLIEWLPRAGHPSVKATIARRLAETGRSSETAQGLLEEYRVATDDTLRWSLADALTRIAPAADLAEIVELAADREGGRGRQMLVYALWRVPTDRSRAVIVELLDDPEVAPHAMFSLRRAFGSLEARRRLEPLADHPSERVSTAARDALRRIDRSLAR